MTYDFRYADSKILKLPKFRVGDWVERINPRFGHQAGVVRISKIRRGPTNVYDVLYDQGPHSPQKKALVKEDELILADAPERDVG